MNIKRESVSSWSLPTDIGTSHIAQISCPHTSPTSLLKWPIAPIRRSCHLTHFTNKNVTMSCHVCLLDHPLATVPIRRCWQITKQSDAATCQMDQSDQYIYVNAIIIAWEYCFSETPLQYLQVSNIQRLCSGPLGKTWGSTGGLKLSPKIFFILGNSTTWLKNPYWTIKLLSLHFDILFLYVLLSDVGLCLYS